MDLRNVKLLVNGSELVDIPEELARKFRAGDRILALSNGDLLHIPKLALVTARKAVDAASEAFTEMSRVSPDKVTAFFNAFARALENDDTWTGIADANSRDVADARDRGRSTTRLQISEKTRNDMVRGLREWSEMPSPIGKVLDRISHPGWDVEQVYSPLGVVAFVFEGRPNVFADGAGVLRSGNTTVMRIGGDALRTAFSIMERAVIPSLKQAGLPEGAVSLVESRDHAAGWALFSDPRVALAVARGSGQATRQLGEVARQSGIPVSLHGTGGAWIMADGTASEDRFFRSVYHSLDRKVCNTLNTLCLTRPAAERLAPVALCAMQRRHSETGQGYRIHVTPSARHYLPGELFNDKVTVHRSTGEGLEPIATELADADLGREWEWERTPEMSLTVVEDLEAAIALFNRYSPKFVASLISSDPGRHNQFFAELNAPFVGDGFTRWVDGQFALSRPELGLSNWQHGRLLGRSGILSGDGIFTVRLRSYQQDEDLHR